MAADPAWQESAITATGPLGPLAGTLTQTRAKGAPVVLIIPGSGPTDRDGNNPLGVSAAPYRLLAHGLAEQGVASVRIDKRGMFASAGAIKDANAVTLAAYADDVRSWIGAIRARTGARCVWVLGHSEGGLVALTAAANPTGICGLILASTPGRPLGPIIRDQLRANPANGPYLEEADRWLTELEAGRHVPAEKISPPLMALFAPQVQDFVIDLLRFDPAAAIRRIDLPVLLVYGGRDIQVQVAEGRLLSAKKPAAQLALFDTANHVLKPVADDTREANLAAYSNPALPLAPGIAERVAGFVKAATHPG